MIVKFNSLNRAERPLLTLCNPGSVYTNGKLSNVVGILTNHEAEECVFNFNQTSELNFRIRSVPIEDDDEANEHLSYMYDAVKNKRLIFVNDIGYFVIDSVDDQHENGVDYKDVSAKSIDAELQQKNIPYIADGTYRFSTSGNDTGILETIVSTIPLWTIDHVDSSVASKYRTFEDVDTSLNCLGFLIDKVQEAYECIVLFDTINRTISVYDQANYVHRTGVHLTKDDVINSLKITEQSDDLYTAITVSGDSDVLISDVNPLGTNTIYNYTYYLDWMTTGLKNKVVAWQNAIDAAKSSYYNYNLDYYTLRQTEFGLEADIEKIECQKKIYEQCLEGVKSDDSKNVVAVANEEIDKYGGTEVDITKQISEIIAQLNSLISTCNSTISSKQSQLATVQTQKNAKLQQINSIRNSLAMNTYFTSAELDELANYTFEGTYKDEYVVITDMMSYSEKFSQMKVLYDRAELQLQKASMPTQEFDIGTENILFAKDFQFASEQLETGCLINVEIKEGDVAELFLSCIKVNYDDHTLSMTFGNRYNKFDPKTLFQNVLGNINKTANTLSFVKDTIYPIKQGALNVMAEEIQSSRDLTMNWALSSESAEVVIDSTGYTGRRRDLDNGGYYPEQIKITNNNIVFTDDAWQTSKAAIGKIALGGNQSKYGVNAEVLIGNIIMGNELHILDSNGNELLGVVDGKINTQVKETLGTTASADAVDYIMPTGITIDFYGYGLASDTTTDTGKVASQNNNKYYLDRKTGKLYKSNGSKWIENQTLTPKFNNYSTTTQMNSAIQQTAGEITSTVSATYETKEDSTTKLNTAKTYAEGQASTAESNAKTYAEGKATDAENNAKGYTDNQLTNYSTTTQMNTAISQTAEAISSEANALIISTVGYSSKNLLLLDVKTTTTNGVTFTVDPTAGTVTANGTASASANAQLAIQFNKPNGSCIISGGDYYFSGCPAGGSSSKYDIYPWDYDVSPAARTKIWDESQKSPSDYGGTSQEMKIVDGHKTGLTIRIMKGVTVNNIVFRPMIRNGAIRDDTFEPYYQSVQTQVTNTNTKITQTANEITSTAAEAVSKFDTTGKTINYYGYGFVESSAPYITTDTGVSADATGVSGKCFLNQTDGGLYQSDGSKWNLVETLSLITSNLDTKITQTAGEITSTVAKAVSKYEIPSGITVNFAGYGTPASQGCVATAANQYYLDQETGNLYKSNSSKQWSSTPTQTLTLITNNLDSKIVQTAHGITQTVAAANAVEYIIPSGVTVNYHGYGFGQTSGGAIDYTMTDTGISAVGISGQTFLNQSNGILYTSDGTTWENTQQQLATKFSEYSTTSQTRTEINQTANSVTLSVLSTTAGAMGKYDETGVTINFYGYGVPTTVSGSSQGSTYLDQKTGYVYTRGSGETSWTKTSELTLDTTAKANAAESNAKTYVDDELTHYTTTTDMNTTIDSKVDVAREAVTLESRSLVEATVGYVNKNLIPITMNSGTYKSGGANLTYTVDKTAGTITFNGTSRTDTTNINLNFYTDSTGTISGNYYITGGYSSKCYVRVYDSGNGWCKKWNGTTSTTGSTSESNSQEVQLVAGHNNLFRVVITPNTTLTNAVVKPMLRVPDITDTTFVPYKSTVQRQIDDANASIVVESNRITSTVADSTSKYDTTDVTIHYYGFGLSQDTTKTDTGILASVNLGKYFLNQANGYVYVSDGTYWVEPNPTIHLDKITDKLNSKVEQTANGILLSASQMIGGKRTKNLIPFVYNATGAKAIVVNGVKIERDGTGFKLTGTPSSSAYFTIYTQDCSTNWDYTKLANVKTLPTGTYIVSGTGFDNNIQYRINYSTDASTTSKIVYFGENGDTTEKTFSITDAMTYVRHYIWVRSGTNLGSGVTVKPMIRDASITDSTYTEGIDSGAYMCSAINLTPEKLELDAGKLIINSGNFQLDANGKVTVKSGVIQTANYVSGSAGGKINLDAQSTVNDYIFDSRFFKINGTGLVWCSNISLSGGTIQTTNYSAASGSTPTVGGKINLSASLSSEYLFDTANFKITGTGDVTATGANLTNCSVVGGTFVVDTSFGENDKRASSITFRDGYSFASDEYYMKMSNFDYEHLIFAAFGSSSSTLLTTNKPDIIGYVDPDYNNRYDARNNLNKKYLNVSSGDLYIATGTTSSASWSQSGINYGGSDYLYLSEREILIGRADGGATGGVAPDYIKVSITPDSISLINFDSVMNTIITPFSVTTPQLTASTSVTTPTCYTHDLRSNTEGGDIRLYSGMAIQSGCGLKLANKMAFWIYNNEVAVGVDTLPLRFYGTNVMLQNGTAVTSDARSKHNIESLDNRYLEVVKNIEPKRFQYISNPLDRYHTGYIAQEVKTAMEKVGISESEMAAFVDVRGDGSELALRYGEFIPMLHKWLKEIDSKVAAFDRRLTSIERKEK